MKKNMPNSELLQSQITTETTNTNNKQSNTQLVDKEHIDGTPFDIVGDEELGYFVAIGNYRITQTHDKEDCRTMIRVMEWELILGLIGACIETAIPRIENIIHNIIELKEKEKNN